ncbi:hypothetical protein [Parageobacillus thermoglucosidasius]|uniref:hypothetical protein n=1 Tax=Parageobacillus thermoglucosidasius TaxID=1426 RepID=UPI0027F7F246|nr:hypothetical protein PthstB1num2_19510 [Parageobacillus thermoglucosidasius]
MEIQNFLTRQAAFAYEQPIILKNGETYEATIKEKLNDNEAIVNIKGTDIRVQVEGELPQEGRVMIEIKAQQGDIPVVKVVPRPQPEAKPQTNDITVLLAKLGAEENVPDELKQAAQLLLSKEMPLTKETVAVLKTFFAEAPGTVEQKLDTIRALVNKKLEVTNTQITAVHEALHGKPLGEVLTSIAKQLDASFTFTKQEIEDSGRVTKEVIANVRKEIQREPNFAKVMERVAELAKTAETDVSEALNRAVREAVVFHEKGQESFARSKIVQTLVLLEQSVSQEAGVQRGMSEDDLVEQVKKLRDYVQREPLVGKAIAIVKEKMVDNKNISHDVQEKIAASLQEVERLRQIGQPLSAKAKLVQALTQMEDEIAASSKTPEVQTHDGAEQTVQALQKAKDIIRNTNNLPEAMQRLKNEIISHVDKKTAAEIETAIERLSVVQKAGKDRLIQALEKIEKELASKQADQTEKTLAMAKQRMNQVGQVLRTNETKPQPPQNLAELVKDVRSQVMREVNLSKALEQVRTQFVHNDRVSEEVRQKADQVLKEVQFLKTNGQESLAHRQVVQALTELEQSVEQEKPMIIRDVANRVKQVREQAAREPNLSKAVEQVRQHIVDAPEIGQEIAKKVDRALREVVQLQQMGREGEARTRLVQALTQAEQELRTQEPANQVKQVREQAIREPNLTKAVEHVRQHIVDAPVVDREVAEKLNRALREVVQLQQQGREVEARVRLTQALDQAEEALRGNGGKSQPSQNLVELVKDVRSQVMKETDLTKALAQVRTWLVHNDHVPVEVQQKMEKAIKDASLLQQIGRETFAKNHLIRTLEQIEKAVAAKEQKPQADLLETIQQIKQTITEAETIEKAIREIRQQLHRFSDNSIVTQLTKAMFEAAKLDKNSREQFLSSLTNLESEHMKDIINEQEISNQYVRVAIRKAIQTLQREANLEKAFDFIKTETMPRVRELGKKLTGSFMKSLQLQESGRELAARQTMLETLAEIEASLPPAANEETDLSTSLNNLFDSEWQTSLQLQTKDIIVQTITKKMSQAAIDFKNIKRDIMRNLETISQLIEKYKQNAQPQAKQLLDTTIKQLDNAILKSDMMLFTDMITEKQLMKASSQLAEARKRLNKGDYSGAQKIVREVKDVLAKMQFKPSDVKVKHFVADESLKFAGSPKEFLTHMNKAVQPFMTEPSARQMFETIRRLGFTHDYEVAESLVFKGNNENTPQQNMKAMLLKLVQSGNEQVAQQAEQALNNLTGQQLLNKFDAGANAQSFFFSLPLLLQNEVRSVKVYVNSRKDGERIDWENCSLYFLLETKKLGDIGILLNANERNLSITFRNDKADFAEKMEPFMKVAKERLEEIGYHVTGVNVTKLTKDIQMKESKPISQTPSYAIFTEKGYDFTI